ncbi:MAG: glutaredoxin family protein [Motiliproteus sp.]|nr:glutaredoxin family protein [Motiliproteus sp.]MCW9051095.1 glutaredoxin family protein [Motiliproteus sp.]
MKHLLFYTTEGCHLCEMAMQLIEHTLDPQSFHIDSVEISESDALVDLYGIRIPVLADPETKAELGWPFDQPQLISFIEQLG